MNTIYRKHRGSKGKPAFPIYKTPKSISSSSKVPLPDQIKLAKTIKKTFIRTQDGLKIYYIDGGFLRSNIDIDFTVGGHHYVYPFIPRNEVWIDSAYSDRKKETEFFLAHELLEIKRMKEGKNYVQAHKLANELEETLRDV